MRDGLRAALLLSLVIDGRPAAAQTAGPPPPQVPADAPSGALSLPAPEPQPDRPVRPRPSVLTIDQLFPADTLNLPRGWSFRFEAPATCTTCAERDFAGVPNANAPWRVSGALDWQGETSALGVRVTGQRGARLPPFMTPSTGGAARPAAASDALLSDSRTHWQLTLNGERIIWRSIDGNAVSLFGEAHLPIGTTGRKAKTGDISTLSPRAVLGGFRVRF